jgi:hypothetical protein
MTSVYAFEEHRAFASAAKLYRYLNVSLRLSPLFLKRNLRARYSCHRSPTALAAIIDTLGDQAQVTFKLQGLAVDPRFRCQLLPLDRPPVELQPVSTISLARCRGWGKMQVQLIEEASSELYALSDWITVADEIKGLRGTLWLRVLEGSSSIGIAWNRSTTCPSARESKARRSKGKRSKRKCSKAKPSSQPCLAQRADKGLQHTPMAMLPPQREVASVDNTCSRDSGMEEEPVPQSPKRTKFRSRRQTLPTASDVELHHVSTQTDLEPTKRADVVEVWPAMVLAGSLGQELRLELEACGTLKVL